MQNDTRFLNLKPNDGLPRSSTSPVEIEAGEGKTRSIQTPVSKCCTSLQNARISQPHLYYNSAAKVKPCARGRDMNTLQTRPAKSRSSQNACLGVTGGGVGRVRLSSRSPRLTRVQPRWPSSAPPGRRYLTGISSTWDRCTRRTLSLFPVAEGEKKRKQKTRGVPLRELNGQHIFQSHERGLVSHGGLFSTPPNRRRFLFALCRAPNRLMPADVVPRLP